MALHPWGYTPRVVRYTSTGVLWTVRLVATKAPVALRSGVY